MLKKKTNYVLNTYLSKLDFINKYNSKNVHDIPKLEQISLTLVNKTNKSLTSFFKSAFFLVVFTSTMPHIFAFEKLKNSTTKEYDSFVLSINIQSNNDMNSFLYYFFNFCFKSFNTEFSFLENRTYFLINNVLLSNFDEIDIYSKILLESFDSISIKFSFLNPKKFCYKSTPLFWLI